jgi:3',5'-cyclic AMP phosphodiesterase CpdA
MPPVTKDAFSIVHLTDLHLTRSDGDHRSSPKLWGELKGMNAAFRKLVRAPLLQKSNLIIVTGDVTDRGHIDSWQLFWNTLRDAGLQDRVSVVPGNHDVCCLGARIPLLGGYKEGDLQKAIDGLKLGNHAHILPWAKVPDPRVVVFGINSNNIGNLTGVTNALGDIDFYQLEKFARLLYKHREVPVKIVAIHHSPNIPLPATAAKRGMDRSIVDRLAAYIPQAERRTLRLLCLTHRVRLVLHGHLHQYEKRRVNSVLMIGAAASTEPVSTGKGFPVNEYRVCGDGSRLEYKPWVVDV